MAQAPRERLSSRWTNLGLELATAVVLVMVLVGAWWLWIDVAHISPLVVARPSRVWADITGSFATYLAAARSTLVTAGIAFLIGVAVGLFAAVVAARVRLLAGVAVPVIVVLAATPMVALFRTNALVGKNCVQLLNFASTAY